MDTKKQVIQRILREVAELKVGTDRLRYFGEDLVTGYGPSRKQFEKWLAQEQETVRSIQDALAELDKAKGMN